MSDAEIGEAYASGETSDSIGQRAGCCGVTVLEIARAQGVPIRKPGRGAPRPHLISEAEIIRRYRDGASGSRIADAAGCTAGTIYRLLRQRNVPVRPPPNPNAGRRKEPADG